MGVHLLPAGKVFGPNFNLGRPRELNGPNLIRKKNFHPLLAALRRRPGFDHSKPGERWVGQGEGGVGRRRRGAG